MDVLKEKIRKINNQGSIEEMVYEYQRTSNPDKMLKIVQNMANLVYKTISEFKNRGVDYEDLSQLGFTGLIVAIHKFSNGFNNRFSTYAVHCIRGEILHFLRDKNLIRYPRWILKTNKIISDYMKDFEETYGRIPTKDEISQSLNMAAESIDEIYNARNSIYNSESLDNSIEQKDIRLNAEMIKTKNSKSFELMMEDRIILWNAIDKLAELQKKIFILNFIIGKTQEEIGKEIGLSQKSVSRHLNESIYTLKKEISGSNTKHCD
jgi:RNA polymerase sigma-B factor